MRLELTINWSNLGKLTCKPFHCPCSKLRGRKLTFNHCSYFDKQPIIHSFLSFTKESTINFFASSSPWLPNSYQTARDNHPGQKSLDQLHFKRTRIQNAFEKYKMDLTRSGEGYNEGWSGVWNQFDGSRKYETFKVRMAKTWHTAQKTYENLSLSLSLTWHETEEKIWNLLHMAEHILSHSELLSAFFTVHPDKVADSFQKILKKEF